MAQPERLASVLHDAVPDAEVTRCIRGTCLVTSVVDAVPASVVGRSDIAGVQVDQVVAARLGIGVGDQVEVMEAMNHPNRPELGTREVPFSQELWIERDDFMEEAPRKFFRLKPGGEVRLRAAYIIRCDEVIKNEAGEVAELRCSYDPDTRSGMPGASRRVKGTIHWVSASHALKA